MTAKVYTLTAVLVFLTSISTAFTQVEGAQLQTTETRTLADWSIENAIAEAKADIKSGNVKIYYAGTIAASPVGVAEENLKLIAHLPVGNGGIGCVVKDSGLRKIQAEYSKKYNELIVQHLKLKDI